MENVKHKKNHAKLKVKCTVFPQLIVLTYFHKIKNLFEIHIDTDKNSDYKLSPFFLKDE